MFQLQRNQDCFCCRATTVTPVVIVVVSYVVEQEERFGCPEQSPYRPLSLIRHTTLTYRVHADSQYSLSTGPTGGTLQQQNNNPEV